MSSVWKFESNPAGRFDGFKDAGIQYFAGSPYSSLAREVIQNSLDARPPGAEEPVRVLFDLVKVPKSEFPGGDGLREALASCQTLAAELEDQDATTFFAEAQEVLESRSIPCLRMADTGTTGLEGPCRLGHPYFAFMKAQGQSVKASTTAGGSYGIGKNAPFALSDLRTIFVSTRYSDREGQIAELAQGKAILMSQRLSAGDDHFLSSTGFYGSPDGCMPVANPGTLPDWLKRSTQFPSEADQRGTSVFVMGFRPRKGWQGLLIASVISNYFEAIHAGRLNVIVDGHEINRETLRGWFYKSAVRTAATSEDVADQLDLARSMYECFIHKDTKEENSQVLHLGHCRVRLLVKEDLDRRVGVLRNGMLITSRMKRLLRFPGFSDFVAVVDCLNPAGNELLRRMENPEHDNFEPERLRDAKEVDKGRKALEYLAKFVRKALKKHARVERGEVTDLDELEEFFQDPDKEEAIPQSDGETNLSGAMMVLARPQKSWSAGGTTVESGTGGVDGGEGNGEGESTGGRERAGGGSSGSGDGSGSGGSGAKTSRTLPVQDVRSISVSRTKRRVIFTPDFSGNATLTVQEMGADSHYDLTVKSASGEGATAKDGVIRGLTVTRGNRVSLDVELAEPFQVPSGW